MALANAGFTVDAVCPSEHPLSATSALRRSHSYRGLSPLDSIVAALASANPDLLIPCDDLATRQLHEIHRARSRETQGPAMRALIERSLGAPESFPMVYAERRSLKPRRPKECVPPEPRW
jgi:hypothetical protein